MPSTERERLVEEALSAARELAGNLLRFGDRIREVEIFNDDHLLAEQAWGVIRAVRLASESEAPVPASPEPGGDGATACAFGPAGEHDTAEPVPCEVCARPTCDYCGVRDYEGDWLCPDDAPAYGGPSPDARSPVGAPGRVLVRSGRDRDGSPAV